MASETLEVESFVMRFVRGRNDPGAGHDGQDWHCVVLHVQTNEEKTFTRFADAVAFISRYIQIGEFEFKPKRVRKRNPRTRR